MYVILVKNCFNLLFLFVLFLRWSFLPVSDCLFLHFFLFPLTVVILQILNRCSRSLFRGTETGSKVNDDIIIIKEPKFSKKTSTFLQFRFLLLSVCFFVFLSSLLVKTFRRFHSNKQARTCLVFLCLFQNFNPCTWSLLRIVLISCSCFLFIFKIIFSCCFRLLVLAFFLFPLGEVIF